MSIHAAAWLYYGFMAVSFMVTVAGATWILTKAKANLAWWVATSIVLMALSMVWLGLLKGWIAVGIAAVLASDRISNWRECRRFGKRVAHAFGVKPNLFFSAVEQSMPGGYSVIFLAQLGQAKTGIAAAQGLLVVPFMQGLVALEEKFGPQRQITDARSKLAPLLDELSKDG